MKFFVLSVVALCLYALPASAQIEVGACCEDVECTVLMAQECIAQGGTFMGGGTDCEPSPCTGLGACCDRFGACFVSSREECESSPDADQWRPEQTCDPNPCVGACCTVSGTCELMSFYLCSADPSQLWRNGPCDPNPCPAATGACCVEPGLSDLCIIATRAMCEELPEAIYLGDGIACSPIGCREVTPTIETSWGQVKSTYR